MFIVKPRLKIVATILAKNEEDIIAQTIEHHLKQGVWRIIFTNNNSTDKTRQIAEKYPEVAEIIDEPGEDHNQSLWVTRMAQIACKLDPDWIIHLDADEHWGGLMSLSRVSAEVAGCQRMYLHPPIDWEFDLDQMRPYLDFDDIPVPQECKIAHRPNPEIVISHGNHGVETGQSVEFIQDVWRHHYPIRSYKQWERKCLGHESLLRRNAICERWKMWYDFLSSGELSDRYEKIIKSWRAMIKNPNAEDFHRLLEFWATPDMQQFFKNNGMMPKVRKYAEQSCVGSRMGTSCP